MSTFAALVLAGQRHADDPFARDLGAAHRALVPVAGVPSLVRVVEALSVTPQVGRIAISTDAPALLEEVVALAPLREAGQLLVHESLASPSRSVLDALERLLPHQSVLVTAADHALLTREILEQFLTGAEPSDADLLVGVVSASRVRARYPEAVRTFFPLRGESYCGANLFLFRTPRARHAAAFWTRAEAFRKRPWRLVRAFGPTALALFALRRLDLDAAFARISRAMDVQVRPVLLPFAEASIDVDSAADLALAERVLAARAAVGEPR